MVLSIAVTAIPQKLLQVVVELPIAELGTLFDLQMVKVGEELAILLEVLAEQLTGRLAILYGLQMAKVGDK